MLIIIIFMPIKKDWNNIMLMFMIKPQKNGGDVGIACFADIAEI